MKINPFTLARIFLIGIALFIAVCMMTSCGGMQKVINKNKSETKTETETKSVTTATASNTETTAITRTITEEFKDTSTAPSFSASITSDEKKLSNGDTIRGETNEVIIKQYKNVEGKTITEFKTKPKKITVPGKRTIVENVNSVKEATVTSKNNQETKQLVKDKKSEYNKDVKRESNLNWTIVLCVSFLILCILFFIIWWFRRRT